MEEAILSRYGLLGLVVFVLVTFGPKILDRLTAWAIQHAENEARADEKMADALIDELKRRGLESEALRQERLAFVAAQNNLVMATHTLTGAITMLEEKIKDLSVLIRDFDDRLRLHFQQRSQGDNQS